MLLHALRPDRLIAAARVFIFQVFGAPFLNVPNSDLGSVLEAAPEWQRSFVLAAAAGVDTAQRVEVLARNRGISCR